MIKTINLNWTGLYTNPNFLNGIYSLDSNLTVNLDTLIVKNSWKLRKSWIKTSGYDVSDIFARQFGPRSGWTSGPNNSFWSIFRFWPGLLFLKMMKSIDSRDLTLRISNNDFHHGEWKISLLKKQNQKKPQVFGKLFHYLLLLWFLWNLITYLWPAIEILPCYSFYLIYHHDNIGQNDGTNDFLCAYNFVIIINRSNLKRTGAQIMLDRDGTDAE